MQLLELALQNARGFSPTARLALKPGYLVLQPPAEGAALGALLTAVLYADGRGSDAAFLAPGQSQGAVRLTLLGNDGQCYRITRALGGAGILERLDPATRAAQRISQDSAEIGPYLRSQAGLPTRTAFEALCAFPLARFPSRACKPLASATAEPAQPSLAQASQVAPAEDLAQAHARIAELEKERATAEEIDKLQFRSDGLASQVFELEATLKGTSGLESALAEAEQAHAACPTIASTGLPEDIVERARRFPAAVAKRDEGLKKLAAEKEAELAEAPPETVPPLTADPRFWAGIGVGAVVLLGAAISDGLWRYAALLDVPAFGFSAVLALQYVDELKVASRVKGKGSRIAEREKKLHDQFDQEAAPLRAAMKTLEVESPEEIVNRLGRREAYQARIDELRGQLDAAKATPEYLAASTRLGQLKAEQERLTAELTRMSGAYVRDVREVERELGRVKASIALAQAPRAAPPTPAGGAAEVLEDPFPQLLGLAADALQLDVAGLGTQLRERAAKYLFALTEKRWSGIALDFEGRAHLIGPAGPVAAGTLAPAELDRVYLAVRLTLAERLGATAKLPLVFDEALSVLDARLHPLLGRMFKQLGATTQVIQVTAQPGFGALADLGAAI
jgi:hypothetical protein